MEHSHTSHKMDRKTVERMRRIHMKALYSKLISLIPDHNSEAIGLPNQLEEVANYIGRLQERIEKMKEKKESLTGIYEVTKSMNKGMTAGSRLPQIEIQDLGYARSVLVISGLDHHFMFYKSIRIIETEGGEVVNANFSIVDDKVFHTIQAQIPDSGQGYQSSRMCKRLKELVHEFSSAP